MISVCSKVPSPAPSMRKYACSGRSTFTPLGTYKNEPPDHTAPCRAENLLSWAGTHLFMKYFCTSSGYSRTAVSIEQKRMPSFAYSSLRPSYTGSWRHTPTTPARCSRSACGMQVLIGLLHLGGNLVPAVE